MHLLGERGLGILIMASGMVQLFIMIMARGEFSYNRIGSSPISKAYNLLNFLTVIIITPLVSILLIKGAISWIGFASVPLPSGWPVSLAEGSGLFFYTVALVFASAGRIVLGTSFQLGGLMPRNGDHLVTRGIYRWVRHPMYGSLLNLVFSFFLLMQNLLFFFLYLALFVVVVRLIHYEDGILRKAYGDAFVLYRDRVKRFIPYLF